MKLFFTLLPLPLGEACLLASLNPPAGGESGPADRVRVRVTAANNTQ